MGMRAVSGPPFYTTNELPEASGFGRFSITAVPPEVRDRATLTAAEHLDWLATALSREDDKVGALLAALLIRHLVSGDLLESGDLGFNPIFLYGDVGEIAERLFPGAVGRGYMAGLLDVILGDLKAQVADLKLRINEMPGPISPEYPPATQ
jgi:hypothetical protein